MCSCVDGPAQLPILLLLLATDWGFLYDALNHVKLVIFNCCLLCLITSPAGSVGLCFELTTIITFLPQRRQKGDEKDKDLRSSKDAGAEEPATMMNQEKEESTEVSRVEPL